jgi:glycolate oxidase iron-sulfur subunit
MHLVDHARVHIERTYRRPLPDRLLRQVIAFVLPRNGRFRLALRLAKAMAGFDRFLPSSPTGRRLKAMLKLAHKQSAPRTKHMYKSSYSAVGPQRNRVILMTGCAQDVLAPSINEAAIRLLTRYGVEVVLPKDEGCCGAIVHHMGKEEPALAYARNNIDAWTAEIDDGGADAIIMTTSGCGTTVKDYGYLFRSDPSYAEKAKAVSAKAMDITEFLRHLPLKQVNTADLVVAYHAACSLQHGQQLKDLPKRLLRQVGFDVRDVPEDHICCGSAGTYNMLQPEISERLKDRKVANVKRVKANVVASGNIGCISQMSSDVGVPVVHTVELLDWATGGPSPF